MLWWILYWELKKNYLMHADSNAGIFNHGLICIENKVVKNRFSHFVVIRNGNCMIEVLARYWIRNYKDYQDVQVRQKYGVLCGAVGIFLNLFLFLGKFLAGIWSRSIAITADAFNNLSDAGSSLIVLLGFHISGQKADHEHPFGHGRIEYVSGLIVAVLIMLMAIELMRTSLGKIIHPAQITCRTVTVVILAFSVLVKLYMYYYNRKFGRKIDSSAMGATALDSVSDAVATCVVLLSTLVSHFTGLKIDGWCGLLVGLFILYAGICAAKDTINPLLGQPADEGFVSRVHEIVLASPEILGMHDLVVHNYGPGRIMMSLHAEVPVDGSLAELHEVVDEIEHTLSDELGCNAVIHMDPVWNDDEESMRMKAGMEEQLHQIDSSLSLHDFRMVKYTGYARVFFDIQEPYSCDLEERELIAKLREKVAVKYPEVQLVVQVDRI